MTRSSTWTHSFYHSSELPLSASNSLLCDGCYCSFVLSCLSPKSARISFTWSVKKQCYFFFKMCQVIFSTLNHLWLDCHCFMPNYYSRSLPGLPVYPFPSILHMMATLGLLNVTFLTCLDTFKSLSEQGIQSECLRLLSKDFHSLMSTCFSTWSHTFLQEGLPTQTSGNLCLE